MRRVLALSAALAASACGWRGEPAVAKVGSLSISRSEFERKLSEVSAGYQVYVRTPNGKRQFLDVLVREKLMLAAAVGSGAAGSPVFKSEMKRLRAEQKQLLADQRDLLLTRLWLDELRRKGVLSVGAEEARDYHRRHPTEVGMSHILLASPEDAQALDKLIRGGTPFPAAAKAHSLDYETAADGGRMSPALYGEIIPDLEDTAFRMRVGEIGGPFKSKFGYHLLRKDYEKPLPFEACQERIMKLLEKQKLDRHLQSLQEKYTVEVIDEQLK